MKQLLLIPVFLLAACASRPPKPHAVAPVPVGRTVTSDGLRTGEQLKEYRLGRYVDARDPLMMHEGHPIYRLETTARWDLRPKNAASLRRGDVVQSATVSANDAVIAEVNKQRAATRVHRANSRAQPEAERTRTGCRSERGDREAKPRAEARRRHVARPAQFARRQAPGAEAADAFTITGRQMVTHRDRIMKPLTTNQSSSPSRRPPSRGTRKRARRSSRRSALRPAPSSS